MNALLVSQFRPLSSGHGGNRRTYQLYHELQKIVGEKNVSAISFDEWQAEYRKRLASSSQVEHDPKADVGMSSWLRQGLGNSSRRVVRSLPKWLQMKIKRLALISEQVPAEATHSQTMLFSPEEFVSAYEQQVRYLAEPTVAVIEHVGFSGILPVNLRYGIHTLGCVQNLETFDTMAPLDCDSADSLRRMTDGFCQELRVLAQCDSRLFISRVETGLIGGLGLRCDHFPYQPVGTIRQRLMRVRSARQEKRPEPGLFLMVGTGAHATTWNSLAWFVEQSRRYGLPRGVRVIVAGQRTDMLLSKGAAIDGIELQGWITPDALDDLLTRVEAVLVPQKFGFGALTRVTDCAFIGVPSIVSRHATYALDTLPSVHAVDDNWQAWCSYMAQPPRSSSATHDETNSFLPERSTSSLEREIRTLLSQA